MPSKLQVVKAALANKKKLSVQKPAGKVSADEPADSLQAPANKNIQGNKTAGNNLKNDIQGGQNNPGATPMQESRGVMSPQPASDSVNAKMKKPQGAVYFKKTVRK